MRARLLAGIPGDEARVAKRTQGVGWIPEYRILLTADRWDDGTPGFFSESPGLLVCMSQGETPNEAVETAREAMPDWIALMLEDGHDVLTPARDD